MVDPLDFYRIMIVTEALLPSLSVLFGYRLHCICCVASFSRICRGSQRPVCRFHHNRHDFSWATLSPCSLVTACIASAVWPASLAPANHRVHPNSHTCSLAIRLHLLCALDTSALWRASVVPHHEDPWARVFVNGC